MKYLLITTVLLLGCDPPTYDYTSRSENSKNKKSASYLDSSQKANLELFSAISSNNIISVKHALANGADINSKTKHGFTPLMIAAAGGNVEIANHLAVKEAELNSNYKGWTSLHRAAFYSNIEIVDFLLEVGLNIDAKDHLGQTPIHWPANYGRLIMVNHLISKGADVNAVAKGGAFSGQTPLDAAIKDDQSAVAELLRKNGGKTAEELKAEVK
jgi:ankyrin repeat protein